MKSQVCRPVAWMTANRAAVLAELAQYQKPIRGNSLYQITTTLLPFLSILTIMYTMVDTAAWASLALAIPAGALIVRIFIIQHDCGHGAFFRSRAANEWVGRFCSLMTMTPFANWRRHHQNHHAIWNNLDRRNSGSDIYSTCLTLQEYSLLPAMRQRIFRLVHHPIVLHFLLPPLVFIVLYRLPFDTPRAWRRERASVWATDVALAVIFAALIWMRGLGAVLLVQVSVMAVASIIGIWIFSVQHHFEHALWTRQKTWNATDAAILGSSYLKLPRLLQWISGNIGFHHIHHLVPRVPNYRLEDCHRALVALGGIVEPLGLREALQASSYLLWDEERGRMIRLVDLQRYDK